MPDAVLCLNAGSSSLKFAVYQLRPAETRLANGAVERIGLPESRVWVRTRAGEVVEESAHDIADHASAARAVFAVLKRQGLDAAAAVGHRIVHGGPDPAAPPRARARPRAPP